MRVVLDTNVLARTAYRQEGPAAELFERLTQSPHVLIASAHIIAELSRVLRYPHLRRLHRLNDQSLDRFVAKVLAASLFIEPDHDASGVAADPDDDLIIATAVSARADVLCTLDHHLLKDDVAAYCRAHSVEVMNDLALLERLRCEEQGDAPA